MLRLIYLKFHRIEETYFGRVHKYSPTLNRKNHGMTGVDVIDCTPTDNLVVDRHMN